MCLYPDCFPQDFEQRILPEGAKANNYNVFRISRSGEICRSEFLSTFEEIQRGKPYRRPDYSNAGIYGTSCYLTFEMINARLMNLKVEDREKAIVMKGTTASSCGPSQITYERTGKNETDYHVDWWIYKAADPENYFDAYQEEELQ